MIIWIFVLAYFKYKEINNISQYDKDSISCSDYAVSIEGVPVDVTKKELFKDEEITDLTKKL